MYFFRGLTIVVLGLYRLYPFSGCQRSILAAKLLFFCQIHKKKYKKFARFKKKHYFCTTIWRIYTIRIIPLCKHSEWGSRLALFSPICHLWLFKINTCYITQLLYLHQPTYASACINSLHSFYTSFLVTSCLPPTYTLPCINFSPHFYTSHFTSCLITNTYMLPSFTYITYSH